MQILLKLADFRQSVSLKELSEACHMPPSKVHRYLVSMVKTGVVFQGDKTTNYALGNSAVTIGLAALQQLDFVDQVAEDLSRLATTINCNVALFVWSKSGPTLISWARVMDDVNVPLKLGQTLALLHSATGRVFASYLHRSITGKLLDQERVAYKDNDDYSNDALEKLFVEIRRKGFAFSSGEFEPELCSLAAPVLDWQNQPVVVLKVFMPKNVPTERLEKVAADLIAFCKEKSAARPSFPF